MTLTGIELENPKSPYIQSVMVNVAIVPPRYRGFSWGPKINKKMGRIFWGPEMAQAIFLTIFLNTVHKPIHQFFYQFGLSTPEKDPQNKI